MKRRTSHYFFFLAAFFFAGAFFFALLVAFLLAAMSASLWPPAGSLCVYVTNCFPGENPQQPHPQPYGGGV